jgi:signal transduction histidine kinase
MPAIPARTVCNDPASYSDCNPSTTSHEPVADGGGEDDERARAEHHAVRDSVAHEAHGRVERRRRRGEDEERGGLERRLDERSDDRTGGERSQLERLNQFLRHEVLNEATKIVGYADLVAAETSDEAQADQLRTIRHSGEEIAVFIDSIRTILDETDHDPDLDPVDLRAVVEREATTIRKTYPGVAVEVTGPEAAWVLGGDLLNRVFRNLMENAVRHNEDVSLSVEVVREGEWVRATVRDDGTGIAAETRESLFDPPDTGTHGFGLYLTRNLTEVYGGRLELVETGASGTTFAVRLPAARAPAAEEAASAVPRAT